MRKNKDRPFKIFCRPKKLSKHKIHGILQVQVSKQCHKRCRVCSHIKTTKAPLAKDEPCNAKKSCKARRGLSQPCPMRFGMDKQTVRKNRNSAYFRSDFIFRVQNGDSKRPARIERTKSLNTCRFSAADFFHRYL